jgi:hypothetical protein
VERQPVGHNRDVVLNLRTPTRTAAQTLAVLVIVVLVANLSSWPPLALGLACLAGIMWSAAFMAPIQVRLTPADFSDGVAPHIEVARWGRRTLYPLDEMTLSVSTYRVSVPVCHMVFQNGRSVGPMLVSEDSCRFMREVIRSLRSQGRHRDAVLWSHVTELERYLDRAGF